IRQASRIAGRRQEVGLRAGLDAHSNCLWWSNGRRPSPLDVAIELGLQHGGWCPRGRRAEDGPISNLYRLRETESANYAVRTERNIIDSDATLILYRCALSSGTKLTRQLAEKHDKPMMMIDLHEDPDEVSARITEWLRDQKSVIETLNVAGPRASSHESIYADARQALFRAISDCTQ
ncbi:MAG: putative molybdenum carrier protein, partial [Pirellulaceae bacterium]